MNASESPALGRGGEIERTNSSDDKRPGHTLGRAERGGGDDGGR